MTGPEKKEKGKNKVFSIVCFCIAAAFFLLAVTIFILASQAKKQNKPLTVFGYSTSIVVTDSMKGEIEVGDLIVVKETTIDKINVGDNAVFVYIGSEEKIKGERVVHKVTFKGTDENGEIYLITKGVNNLTEDADRVTAANFVGKEISHNSFFGKIFGFFSRTENIFYLIVLVIVVPFIVKQTRKIIRLVGESKRENGGNGTDDKADESGEQGNHGSDEEERERLRQEILKEYGVNDKENDE